MILKLPYYVLFQTVIKKSYVTYVWMWYYDQKGHRVQISYTFPKNYFSAFALFLIVLMHNLIQNWNK